MKRLTPGARRAVRRIAWRDAMRNRGRTLLVVAMIAIPVAGLVTASIAIASGTSTPEQRIAADMGTADFRVGDDVEALADLVAAMPSGTEVALVKAVGTWTVVNGGAEYVAVEAADLDDPVLMGKYRLLEGRNPAVPGEIALTPELLNAFGLSIGDTIELTGPDITATITGTVVNPEQTWLRLGVVSRDGLDGVDTDDAVQTTAYFAVPEEQLDAALAAIEAAELSYSPRFDMEMGATITAYGASFGVAALALAETALIAAAAFVVGARRQLRTLGLAGAAGATPRQVRGIVLATGSTLGVVGSVTGAVLGVIFGLMVVPHLDRFVGRLVDGPVFPFPVIVGAMTLGVIAAVAAAWIPARSAARISTVDALARRTPPPSPPRRRAWIGVVAVFAGAALVAWGTITHVEVVLTLGVFGMLGGMLLTIPLLVTLVGRSAGRFPLPLRIAGRDTGRHGRRTAAAVAAATLALALPIAVSALLLSDEARYNTNSMGADNLLIGSETRHGNRGLDEEIATLQEVADAVAAGIETEAMAPILGATYDSERWGGMTEWMVYAYGQDKELPDGSTQMAGDYIAIGGEELLRALHAEDMLDELQAGMMVVLGSDIVIDGTMNVEFPLNGPEEAFVNVPVPAVESGRPGFSRFATIVVSEERAAELGLVPGSIWDFIVRTTDVMDGEALVAAKQAAATVPGGYVVGLPDTQFGSVAFQNIVLGFAAIVALAIVGVAVALVSVETRRDQAVLVAVGAGPRMRRKIVASSALLLSGLAAALAVPAGFLPVAVLQVSRQAGYPVIVPWLSIAVVLLAVPPVAGLVAGAVSRRPAPRDLLRPQE